MLQTIIEIVIMVAIAMVGLFIAGIWLNKRMKKDKKIEDDQSPK
jgi:FtsZ-interacting cell division protein ZipA